jgi:hypothetical protein
MNETSMAARAVDLFQSFERTEESLFINSNLPRPALLLTRQALLLSFAASCLAGRRVGQLNYSRVNLGEHSTRKCLD